MPQLIEIKHQDPSLNEFFGSWFIQGPLNMLVDVGPAACLQSLLAALSRLGIETLDYVLLTHIHLDHAGGLGGVLEKYPEARVVCHRMAVPHLVDPSRLWAGSIEVLGEMGRAYGPPKPVREDSLIPHDEARVPGLRILETPGHAPHHISFSYQGHLYVGEASGVYLETKGAKAYMRPATPPRFFLEVSLKSVDALMDLEDHVLCYAHFGRAESSHEMLSRFRRQLLRWQEVLDKALASNPKVGTETCVRRLLEEDPDLSNLGLIPGDKRRREMFFLENSVKGYLEYLRASSSS